MSQAKKLFNDTILYGIAHFGSSALTFLMLPLYTRYFSPSEYGMWDIVVTSISLFIPFLTFELTTATYRWLLDHEFSDYQTIISTGFFQIIRHLVLFNIIVSIIFLFISFSYRWEALLFMNIMIILSFIQQCARGLKRNILFAMIGLLQTTIVICLNLLFILIFKLGIEAFFYANIIAGVICIIVAWRKLRFRQYINWKMDSKKLLQNYLAYAIPIIPAAASWWVMTMADRWMIAAFLGVNANGIYAIALKIPAILLMMNTIFSLAWKDSVITSFHTPEKNLFYSMTFQLFFRLMATSVICLTLLSKPLIAFFIGAAYFDAWRYCGILLVATLFHALALFWSAGFHGAKQTKAILSTSIVGAIINVLLNFLLIPYLGLSAVAVATLVAFLVTWLLRIRSAKTFFNITINWLDMIILSIFMISANLIPFYTNKIGLTISIFLSLILFLVYNKKMLIYLKKEIGTKASR